MAGALEHVVDDVFGQQEAGRLAVAGDSVPHLRPNPKRDVHAHFRWAEYVESALADVLP